jgi:transposase
MRKKIAFVGMDVHKDSVTLAVLIESESETEWVKTYPYDLGKLRKVFNRLSGEYDVRSCYEASGAGYCLHRTLQEGWGVTCDSVAPSLIPKRSGDRRKTDRRDAENLAQLYRAGQLTPIRVPDAAEESVRDLCRCRETFGRELLRSRHYVLKFLRRRGFVYRDGSHWTRRHMAWIRSLELEETDQAVLDEYVSLLEYHLSRAVELDRRIEELAFSTDFRKLFNRQNGIRLSLPDESQCPPSQP